MRPIWRGSISFGLVNIPVRLYSGSEYNDGLDLDMLHNQDKARIYYKRVCSRENKEVSFKDIVKGYQYQKGKYVVLEEKDFAKANARKTSTIEIKQFTDEAEIDSRYYDKPYYLEPERSAAQAYSLLREALERCGKVAIATFVLRARENLAVIKALDRALILNQLRFPSDVKEPVGLKFPAKSDFSDSQLKMATTLINQLTKHFIPEDFKDTYTEELERLIARKIKGQPVRSQPSKPKPTSNKDLMETLKASLQKGRK